MILSPSSPEPRAPGLGSALLAAALAAAIAAPRLGNALELSQTAASHPESSSPPLREGRYVSRLRAAGRVKADGGAWKISPSWGSWLSLKAHNAGKSGGAPVTNSEMFSPDLLATAGIPNISPNIFCKQPDNQPACPGDNCCCWSTFGLPHHPAYPNPSEGQVKRQCLNPPEGFVYITVPGEVNDEGEDEAIKLDSTIPVYDGRNLCCTVAKGSPEYFSQRDVVEGVPTLKPPPTTTTTTVPPTTTTITTTTNPYADFEAIKMEEASSANEMSAKELGEAAGMLNVTVDELVDTVEAMKEDPRLAVHRVNIARLRKAIHNYNAKEWASMKTYHTMANFKEPGSLAE